MKHTFSIDRFGWVVAVGEDGGILKTQRVEALLMLEILTELRKVNERLAALSKVSNDEGGV